VDVVVLTLAKTNIRNRTFFKLSKDKSEEDTNIYYFIFLYKTPTIGFQKISRLESVFVRNRMWTVTGEELCLLTVSSSTQKKK
jgi:hypothetical protein